MSMPVSIYRCSKCDFSQQSDSLRGIQEYLLPNGVRLPMESATAWCEDCSRIVRMESFQFCVDNVAKALTQKADPHQCQPVRHWWDLHLLLFPWIWKKRYQAWQQEVFDYELALADSEEINQLVNARTSGKCLECGSVAVSGFADGQEHPHCGGRISIEPLRVAGGSEVWISHQEAIDLYSENGLYIRTEAIDCSPLPNYFYRNLLELENARIRGILIPPSVEKAMSAHV